MATVNDLVTAALRTCRAIDALDTPDANEAGIALAELNGLLETYTISGWLPVSDVTTTFTLTPGQSTFTIGSTGDLVVARPDQVKAVKILVGNLWRNIQIVSNEDWAQFTHYDNQSSVPVVCNYNPAFPLSELSFYPAPDSAYPMQLTYAKQMTNVELDTILQLPPGYYPAIQYELASLLGGIFHIPDLGDVRGEALRRKALIMRLHDKGRTLQTTAPKGRQGFYNIRSWSN